MVEGCDRLRRESRCRNLTGYGCAWFKWRGRRRISYILGQIWTLEIPTIGMEGVVLSATWEPTSLWDHWITHSPGHPYQCLAIPGVSYLVCIPLVSFSISSFQMLLNTARVCMHVLDGVCSSVVEHPVRWRPPRAQILGATVLSTSLHKVSVGTFFKAKSTTTSYPLIKFFFFCACMCR